MNPPSTHPHSPHCWYCQRGTTVPAVNRVSPVLSVRNGLQSLHPWLFSFEKVQFVSFTCRTFGFHCSRHSYLYQSRNQPIKHGSLCMHVSIVKLCTAYSCKCTYSYNLPRRSFEQTFECSTQARTYLYQTISFELQIFPRPVK